MSKGLLADKLESEDFLVLAIGVKTEEIRGERSTKRKKVNEIRSMCNHLGSMPRPVEP